jgi:tetratricopeptide (TPR) repeat protein
MRYATARALSAVAMMFSVSMAAFPAAAQEPQARTWCFANDRDDQVITGCTELIQSGRESQNNLAAEYNNRCLAYVHKGNSDQAIADCTQAIQLNPKEAAFYTTRCGAYNRQGNNDQAIADCTQAIQLNPRLAAAYNDRCFAYINKGNNDQAITDCTQAIQLNPKYSQPYNSRCRDLHQQRQ